MIGVPEKFHNSRILFSIKRLYGSLIYCGKLQKNTKEGRTFTEVLPLEYEQRIGEIARIMSGSDLTENLYNSAKELLDRSNFNDNL